MNVVEVTSLWINILLTEDDQKIHMNNDRIFLIVTCFWFANYTVTNTVI